jgi:hypothetical protein
MKILGRISVGFNYSYLEIGAKLSISKLIFGFGAFLQIVWYDQYTSMNQVAYMIICQSERLSKLIWMARNDFAVCFALGYELRQGHPFWFALLSWLDVVKAK